MNVVASPEKDWEGLGGGRLTNPIIPKTNFEVLPNMLRNEGAMNPISNSRNNSCFM